MAGEFRRITTNFVPRAAAAIDRAVEITGDNQSDCLNRAIQVYAYLEKMTTDGNLIFIENPATGARERLVLL